MPVDASTPGCSPMQLIDAAIVVRAFEALAGAGVFAALEAEPATTADLATAKDLDASVLRPALEVAGHAGLLRCDDGTWTLDADAATLQVLLAGLDTLPERLSGVPGTLDVGRRSDAERTYPPLVGMIGSLVDSVADAVVPHLLDRRPTTVLEIAAGSAPWGRVLCRRDPAVRITAVDLPATLTATADAVERAGLTERFTLVGADVFDLDRLDRHDLVVLAGFCRILGPEANAALFQRAARWCRPGGQVAVIDAVDTVDTRSRGLARYELSLRTRATEGRCYRLDAFARWITDAGFDQVRLYATHRPEFSLLLADHPERTDR